MLTALFRRTRETDDTQEQALEIAQTTLMNRVNNVVQRSAAMQEKFAYGNKLRTLQY